MGRSLENIFYLFIAVPKFWDANCIIYKCTYGVVLPFLIFFKQNNVRRRETDWKETAKLGFLLFFFSHENLYILFE